MTENQPCRTVLPDVYAIGDSARGPSLVVLAIRDGREVANEIRTNIQAVSSVSSSHFSG